MKTMNVYAYAKLSKEEKQELVRSEGLFVEMDQEGEKTIFLYYLCGFFVEVTYQNGEEVDNIPYKRGFRVKAAYEVAA